MHLYLVQHGRQLSKEIDSSQPLSEEGLGEVETIAQMAADKGIFVQRIEHSSKTRARETASRLNHWLHPPEGMAQRGDIGPLDDVAPLAQEVRSRPNLMLVGHLPFLDRLTTYLILGKTAPTLFRFQNAGIVCLDLDEENGQWGIVWTLMPHVR